MGCRSLQSISHQSGQKCPPLSLRRLTITDCSELSCLPSEMIESTRCLELLSVTGCEKLISFPIDLGELPCISVLFINSCPELRSLPKGIGRFSNLTELDIGGFSESIDFNSFQAALDCIQQSKSLRELSLYGWEHWDSLPYQLQNLTSLRHLKSEGFGIEALPEWFGGLTSLFVLILCKLKKLKHMPSKEAMQRLTKLKYLEVTHSPLLEERGPDFEWSKISHIPHIRAKGQTWLKRPRMAGGGLAVMWKEELNASIVNFSSSHISLHIKNHFSDSPLVLTGFYGSPVTGRTKESWRLLGRLNPGRQIPWLVMGDFNEITKPSEKFGAAVRPFSQMNSFCKVIDECELSDGGYVGPKFTWSNKREGNQFTKARLDRALVNPSLYNIFSNCVVQVLPVVTSDHNPLLISCNNDHIIGTSRRTTVFRYEAAWSGKQECIDIVGNAWATPCDQRSPLRWFQEEVAIATENQQRGTE
ncbi:unnamed protein product [Fraxinus pennsylvanica]|uniref:Endonuclease/exonuclease/phosphatase domain-containing protein n=1 Tax=Fraxinus pennsylvanica TaxID=56036 RepID=A0AAD2DQU2_9LAMI|nr:unnamed protein product [Fraxinus pennsylvanica]